MLKVELSRMLNFSNAALAICQALLQHLPGHWPRVAILTHSNTHDGGHEVYKPAIALDPRMECIAVTLTNIIQTAINGNIR